MRDRKTFGKEEQVIFKKWILVQNRGWYEFKVYLNKKKEWARSSERPGLMDLEPILPESFPSTCIHHLQFFNISIGPWPLIPRPHSM